MNRKELITELNYIRLEKGITQKEIEKKTGIAQCHISKFFKADFNPGLDAFISIAEAIGQEIKITETEPDWDYLLKQLDK